ncbi:hypothetical protein CEC48_11415 [Pseudomonas sp. K2I15]|nr:hypothetical protein CEC48_11415 [Pseudomonas sp. K2I15]
MRTAPEYSAYPRARKPDYSRWWAGGVVLLFLVIVSVGLRFTSSSFLGWEDTAWWAKGSVGLVYTLAIWPLAFVARVLYHSFASHNAYWYAKTTGQIQQDWWERHRQKVALMDAVLLGPSCSTRQHGQQLLSPDHQPPTPEANPEGPVIRLPHVSGADSAEREHQLARLLALQWDEQREKTEVLQPLCCYWQGSLSAWQVFVEQMTQCCPQLRLPESPEPWQGLRSLDSIIDRLQHAPDAIRVLCAGCQSTSPERDRLLPAGEAAVLWWLGPRGGVRFSRGEWFTTAEEELATVAQRALQQSKLEAPAPSCVSFSQPDIPELSIAGWNIEKSLQDANFGALAGLELMVASTLAAWHAEQHGKPCAWLANDPHHTLVLGVAEADESSQ